LKTRANMLAKYIRKANEQQVRQQVPRRAGNSLMRMSSMSLPSPFTEVQPGKEKTEPWKKINIAGLTRPDLFLDALLTVTARFEFGDPYKYKLQYTISTQKSQLRYLKKDKNEWEKVLLSGMHLVNAYFDEKTCTIQPTKEFVAQPLPVIVVTVCKKARTVPSALNLNEKTDTNVTVNEDYHCPVWIYDTASDELEDEAYRQPHSTNTVFQLPISSETQASVWSSMGVHAICSFKKSKKPP